MVDVPHENDGAPLRTVVPDWLTRPPEVELLRREAARVRAAELAAISTLARDRWRGAAGTGAAVLAGCSLAFCLLAGASPAVAGLLVAALVGALAGVGARSLGDGVHLWGLAMFLGAGLVALYDGAKFTLLFLPVMSGFVGVVAGFGRDPSFRIR